MKIVTITFSAAAAIVALAATLAFGESTASKDGVTRVPVVIFGGHDTDPRDGGRPVILVASALGVPSEVFREAFTHVHPAGPGSGGPTREEARANKAALMSALGKYGVTNERLDEVSNYYRYVRSRGELWKVKQASANALVQNGVITGFEIVNPGAGYSTPPTITVPKMNGVKAQVKLSFNKDLASNGSISAITLTPVH